MHSAEGLVGQFDLAAAFAHFSGVRLGYWEAAIRKLKHQDSHKNHLLQVAYIVCGAVARSFSGKEDARTYRSLISHREMEVQVWPK